MRRWLGLSIRLATLASILVTVLALVGCSSDNEESSSSTTTAGGTQFAGTIKIGAIHDYSGAGANPISLSLPKGLEAGVRDVNAAGGVVVGGQHYKLEFVNVDAKSEPVQSLAAANDLIQQKVIAVDIGSLNDETVYQTLKAANILSVTVYPSTTIHLQTEGPAANPLMYSQIEQFAPIIIGWNVQISKLFPNIKRAAYFGDNGPIAVMRFAEQAAAQAAGMEYVGEVLYPVGTTDLSTYLTNLKALRPDIVYFSASGAGLPNALKAAADLQVAPYLEAPGVRPKDMELAGDLKGTIVISTDWRLPFSEGVIPDQYKDAVAKLGTLPNNVPLQVGFTISEYDWVWVLKQAIEKAGTTTDSRAIANAMIGQKYTGPFGTVEVQQDHSTKGTMGLWVGTAAEYKVYVYNNVGETTPAQTFTFPRR